MTRVKICGHTREADIAASVATGADAIGVISGVPVDSPRAVDSERAADLLEGVPPFVTGVLVTMPETPNEAIELVERTRPDVLQIHGPFDPDGLEVVRETISRPVIKSVDATDLEEARAFDPIADALLIDSTDASGAGGTGRTHDWERTGELATDLDSPVVLAGGLTPKNIAEAVEIAEPFGVDVASGVERNGGVKDHDAVERFVRQAKAGDVEVPAR
ncbi:phosphoribosylanthranilate isomerase [Halalkalicoccus jeotgali]|uniref:N-(5'-phosphoribosyl)anthranilate isomerase n=1 Tax=Halalkalicoccus jeotgali (strain DSM 18796 / CECT 7217 / JCM 14584 / KCTC 4019 / B3) TaxID=795797 RepID=D8J849_HALJB|nr:phosphoribosylanthranilate isomerase [Halalkalicoccus jeotgali]ADJ14162.1 phosphoribosylanthranilate isomerase [Halalkalicoccus jeotgali B3]ELY34656.1 phosphoribosylanthranilate isomerase [Halalkalicoccus jeotgali B3]